MMPLKIRWRTRCDIDSGLVHPTPNDSTFEAEAVSTIDLTRIPPLPYRIPVRMGPSRLRYTDCLPVPTIVRPEQIAVTTPVAQLVGPCLFCCCFCADIHFEQVQQVDPILVERYACQLLLQIDGLMSQRSRAPSSQLITISVLLRHQAATVCLTNDEPDVALKPDSRSSLALTVPHWRPPRTEITSHLGNGCKHCELLHTQS